MSGKVSYCRLCEAFHTDKEPCLPARPSSLVPATGSETRKLCPSHPTVNYKAAWGCPDCVRELREQLKGLIQECEYSASSGLPFNALGEEWTQLAKAKSLLSKFPNAKLCEDEPEI